MKEKFRRYLGKTLLRTVLYEHKGEVHTSRQLLLVVDIHGSSMQVTCIAAEHKPDRQVDLDYFKIFKPAGEDFLISEQFFPVSTAKDFKGPTGIQAITFKELEDEREIDTSSWADFQESDSVQKWKLRIEEIRGQSRDD